MTLFLLTIAILTVIFSGLFALVKKKVVSIYRGGLFIVLSGLYFSSFFMIAYIMRESFR